MNTKTTISAACGLLICCGVPALADGQRWAYTDHTLDNGLRVICMEDHSAPIVAVQVWYHVGSKDENPERNGFAHMFEHMMFRGTDRIGPEDHFKYLRRYGGVVNGYTFFDQTVYIQEVPPNQVDLTFWLEAERMANLKINEEYFTKEREVVKEEYRRGVSDPPYGRVLENALALAFKKHPYRWSPIGNLDHLNAATAKELREFFDTYYVPNNATLVVVGDVKPDEVLAKARKYFGWIPRSPDPVRVTTREPEMTAPRRAEMYDKAPLALVGVGYHAPTLTDGDRHALAILDRILSGESGKVYKKLVKDQEMAVAAGSQLISLEQDGLWAVGAVVKPGASVEETIKVVRGEVAKIKKDGVTRQELEKARNQVAAQAVRQRETVSGKARRLGTAAVIQGDIEQVNKEYGDLMAVSADDVQQVANKYFADNRELTFVVRPETSKISKSLSFFKKFTKRHKSGAGEKKSAKGQE